MALSESTRTQISNLVTENRVILFMKGNRTAPQCGFSAQVVQILDELLPTYETVDVLRSPELRDGIKEFSEWPTIPQLFIDGKLVGGCDIVRELQSSGELQKLLDTEDVEQQPPTVTMTAAAAEAFRAALADAQGESLRLKIDPKFKYDLYFGPRQAGDVEVQVAELTLLLDRGSARRAEGVNIDFVEGANGGFKIQSPQEPPAVKQLTASALDAMLDRNEIVLFDVRPDAERAVASIAGARALSDPDQQAYLLGLDRSTPIAFHCHHGIRSQAAAEQLLAEGFRNVFNLKGGIEAWSQDVDPSVPRY
jgi:monothiol glutaredoxin